MYRTLGSKLRDVIQNLVLVLRLFLIRSKGFCFFYFFFHFCVCVAWQSEARAFHTVAYADYTEGENHVLHAGAGSCPP